ncbi:unnamed protein product [Dibothriocephalus latus]|uniref:Uncharacterized protein n=1 Tax=Dibothriocephalus latus TaxID=60516 RepID=A0A3P7N893_DIBLA|nr:unnamed protein product [Dibothriocephalus latus]
MLTFKEWLNDVFLHIQFTIGEENNQLAFLDILVCRKDAGGLKTKVFRKMTNTMEFLNFNSNQRSCVRALYRRAQTHCSEEEDKIAELCDISDDSEHNFREIIKAASNMDNETAAINDSKTKCQAITVPIKTPSGDYRS